MFLSWFWLMLAVCGSTAGNVLMKFASQRPGDFFSTVFSVPFIMGAFLFAAGLFCYLQALRALPLSIAYPTLVGVTLVTSTVMAVLLFGERIGISHLAGMLCVFAGIFLLTRNPVLV